VRARWLSLAILVTTVAGTIVLTPASAPASRPSLAVYRDRTSFIASTRATGRVLVRDLPPDFTTRTVLKVHHNLRIVSHSGVFADYSAGAREATLVTQGIPTTACPLTLQLARQTRAAGVFVSTFLVDATNWVTVTATDRRGRTQAVVVNQPSPGESANGFVGFRSRRGIDAITVVPNAARFSTNVAVGQITYTPGGRLHRDRTPMPTGCFS
jgi:hypothetical protein